MKIFARYFLLLFPLFIVTAGQLFFKVGADQFNQKNQLNIFFVAGYCCLLGRGLLWILILKFFNLSFAFPLMSLSYLFVLFFSKIILHEVISVTSIFSVTMICVGVFFIALGEMKRNKQKR